VLATHDTLRTCGSFLSAAGAKFQSLHVKATEPLPPVAHEIPGALIAITGSGCSGRGPSLSTETPGLTLQKVDTHAVQAFGKIWIKSELAC
jgi:hypothetical protein